MNGFKNFKVLNSFSILAFLLPLFSIFTLTYSLWPIFNRIVGFFIIIFLGLCSFYKFKTRDFVLFLLIFFVDFVSILLSQDKSRNGEDAIYWSVFLVFLWKVADADFRSMFLKEVIKLKRYYKLIFFISFLFVFIELLLPYSYGGQWFGSYFLGLSYSQHTLCCACCICMASALFFIKDYRNDFFKIVLFFPFTFAVLQSGARTYLISILVLWVVLFKNYIASKKFKLYAIPIILVLGAYFFFTSGMMEKIVFSIGDTYTSNKSIVSFTSGRLDFWLIDLTAYFDLSPGKLVFGGGFDYVYYINSTFYHLNIWAHNDFINTLLCNGLLGLAVYSYVFVVFYKSIRCKFSVFYSFFLFFYVFGVAFINGLFEYQHYLYSIVLLFVALQATSNNKTYHQNKIMINKGAKLCVQAR